MANNQGARIGKSYNPITSKITVTTQQLVAQDVSDWKTAINSARNELSPNRDQLQKIYKNIILDGRIKDVMRKRRLAVTNVPVEFIEHGGGETDNDFITENILGAPWLREFITHAIDSVSYGHSLIELQPDKQTAIIDKVKLLPRQLVVPEKSFLKFETYNDKNGINYETDKVFSPWLIGVGDTHDLGLLETGAFYVLMKRAMLSDWATFLELFGMPFRVGKYNPYDEKTRQDLEKALKDTGSAAYAVIPEGAGIEFFAQSNTGNSAIFSDFRKSLNEEISITWLGQTMTTDDGSSRSQSETHQFQQSQINQDDMAFVETVLNFQLRPKLQSVGYDLNGLFRLNRSETLPREKEIEIWMKASERVRIAPEDWYDKFGINPPADGDYMPTIHTTPPPLPPGTGEKKKPDLNAKSSLLNIRAFYKGVKPCCDSLHITAKEGDDKVWDAVVKGIHDGTIKAGTIEPGLFEWIFKNLLNGVQEGYGKSISDVAEDTADYAMLQRLENNVHVFSAHKTYQELRAATDALLDDGGKLRSFSSFKAKMSELNKQFNELWLESEYNLAVSSSQSADKWTRIQEQKETFPLLEYSTVGDASVRPAHAALNGTLLPADHSFWNSHYPPNDWGCRCYTKRQRRGTVTPAAQVATIQPPAPMFNNNVGKNGVIFPNTHPYFGVAETDKASAAELWGLKKPHDV